MAREYYAIYRPYGITCKDSRADVYVRFTCKAQHDKVLGDHWDKYEHCTKSMIPKDKEVVDYTRMIGM